MTEYHTVYEGPEGETTEWDDIQTRLGNKAPKEPAWKPETYTPEEGPERLNKERIDAAGEEELEGLEDDPSDDRFLEAYRAKRLAELRKGGGAESAPRNGSYDEISRSEFVARVTKAPEGTWVVVHLYDASVRDCAVMDQCLGELATRYPATRFLRIRSTDCIPGYPSANLPTVLIYRSGKNQATIVGLGKFGGQSTSPDMVALALNSAGDVCGDDDPAATAARVRAIVEAAARRKDEQERKDEDARADD